MSKATDSLTTAILETLKAANDKATDGGKDRFANAEVHIRRHGTKITLPAEPVPMRYDEAITCLQRRIKEEEQEIDVYETINAFPFDGAHAFMEALKEIYGWASPDTQIVETMFGKKKIKPVTLNIETDVGVFKQIIWGKFLVPGVDGELLTGGEIKDGKPSFVIRGTIKKKDQEQIAKIADLTRQIVKERSIYKGKGIAFKVDDEGDVDFMQPPSFLDLSRVNAEELTFSEETATQVETSLFTPIEHTEACRVNQIPLKRGILLEGPFGTGKTLTAFVTAQKARANGWTFILVDRVSGLEQALTFARMYQPAVVFAEDVDRAVAGQERTEEIDDILNTIDGISSKGSEVITILTSNDVKGINKAMLRPGRLDAIISVQAPDAKAAEKLTRIYARSLISPQEDLTEAGKELLGQIPATIREVVERAKLFAISRAKSAKIKLVAADIVHAARGMKAHLALMMPAVQPEFSDHELLGRSVAKVVAASVKGNGLYESATKTEKMTQEIHQRVVPQ